MIRVFVSHASEDAPTAATVQRWLADARYRTFLDGDANVGIAVGDDWHRRLHERLRWADAVVCIVTAAYVASPWCNAEIAVAQSRGCRLLPLLVEPTEQHPLLQSIQHVRASGDFHRARDTLLATLRRISVGSRSGWSDDRSPFPGLRPFDTDDRGAFFGRERESAELASLLRSPAERSAGALLLIVGPSGCGKSSLVRAGLVPSMEADDEWLTTNPVTPGSDPVAALSREIAATASAVGLGWTVAEVRDRLETRGLSETADELLLATHGRRRLLLVVDQFEELLTQATAVQRARFAAQLQPALVSSVQAVATLRPEFLDRLLLDTALAVLPTQVYTLRPLPRSALESVIEGPAEIAGITVEDGLTARLVDDTGSGEALPLLAFTLAELGEGVTHGGTLLNSRYDQLGGVQGAVGRQAEKALAAAMEASGRSRADVLRELLRLVTVDEHGSPTRWRVHRDELPDVARLELDAFVARRLLITDREDGRAAIGVAHEAFLSAWPPLAETIADAAIGLRARRSVEQAAAEWAENGRPSALLWERGRLAAHLSATGTHLLATTPLTNTIARVVPVPSLRVRRHRRTSPAHRVDLTARAEEFLRSSIRRDRRRRRRGTTILSALLVAAVTAAALAVVQQQSAEARQHLATARLLLTQAQDALTVDPRTAIRLGEAAVRTNPSAETRAGLVDLMLRSPFATSLEGHTGAVFGIAFSRDGRRLAVSAEDGTTILWDFSDPAHPRQFGDPFSGHQDGVYDVAFSPDGRTLATAGDDGSVVLWNIEDPVRPQTVGDPLPRRPGPVYSVDFTPDGRVLASLGVGGSVTLWNITELSRPFHAADLPVGPTEKVVALALARKGTVLAATTDAGVTLWNISDPAAPSKFTSLTGLSSLVGAVAFSPDGHLLATGQDSTALLWDVEDPAQPRLVGQPLTGHAEVINDAAFAPDGHTLATAGADGNAIVWDIADIDHPRRVRTLQLGSARTVYALQFAPDGRTLVTAGTEGAALTWDMTNPGNPRPAAPLQLGPGKVASIAFAPHGRALVVATEGRSLLWDVADLAAPRAGDLLLAGQAGNVITDSEFTRDGRTLFTAGVDGTTTAWDVSEPVPPRRLGDLVFPRAGPLAGIAASADGRLLAIGSKGGLVQVWDASDRVHPVPVGQPLTGLGPLDAIDMSPEGKILATVSSGATSLWDITDLGHVQPHATALDDDRVTSTAVAFAPDGHTLATAGADGTEILWDVEDPSRPQRIGDPLIGPTNRVGALAFAPDGQTLAAASEDGTLNLWDLTDPAHNHRLGDPLIGSRGALRDVTFSADGQVVAASGDDGQVFLWDLGGTNDLRSDPLDHACAMTRRGLDRAEWARYLSDIPYVDACR